MDLTKFSNETLVRMYIDLERESSLDLISIIDELTERMSPEKFNDLRFNIKYGAKK